MTPEKQRIAIAEACGKASSTAYANGCRCDDCCNSLPDYLNDLNAAIALCDLLAERGWKAELGNGLDKTWECVFYKSFTKTTHRDNVGERDGAATEEHYGSGEKLSEAISSAFLRAINKWEDQ